MSEELNAPPFTPDWAEPPGGTIADAMLEFGITHDDLSDRLKMPLREVHLLIAGKVRITEDLAFRLSYTLGSTVQFWLTRDEQYVEATRRLKLVKA